MALNEIKRGPGADRKRATLADQVASLIEDRIIQGTLAPGDRLPIEYDLAAELNVSRTVIRDAVRTLAARRLVDVRQGLGTVVTTPKPEGYAEAALTFLVRSECTLGALWDARRMLDIELPLAAVRSGRADWSRAEQALGELEDAIAARDWDAALDAHARFHLGLMTAVRNPVIDLLLQPMLQIIAATSDAPAPPAKRRRWDFDFARHPPMLDAARAGNEKALRRAVEEHYAHAERPEKKALRNHALRDSAAAREALRQLQNRAQ